MTLGDIAGVPQITVDQPKGTHLKMRMGELLREDGSIEYNTTGSLLQVLYKQMNIFVPETVGKSGTLVLPTMAIAI